MLLASHFDDLLEQMTSSMADGFRSTRSEDIPSGSDWFDEIHKALNKSCLTVVLLTPQSSKREWVLYEYGYARSRMSNKANQAKVVPILFGMSHADLEGPFKSTQIRRLESRADFIEILKDLASAFEVPLNAQKATQLARKFYPKIEKCRKVVVPSVNPDDYGITGIFPGVLKNDPSVLRSLASARQRIIIAGPSLSTPLAEGNPPSLRHSITVAIRNGVNVYIFLANPTMRFGREAKDTIVEIENRFPQSNTEYALNAIRTIYKDLRALPSGNVGNLHVVLVNKMSLDFAILCDESNVLCRSTIHWTPHHLDQGEIGRHREHDYKPPIIEATATDSSKDSFFAEYKNYLENLMYSAGFPSATPDNPALVKRLFKVKNISDVLMT